MSLLQSYTWPVYECIAYMRYDESMWCMLFLRAKDQPAWEEEVTE